MYSEVQPFEGVRLPGQAEWTATAGVSWTPDRLPLAVHLWYGAIGPRTVGPVSSVQELATVVEPFHRLDAAIDVPLGAGFLLRAFAENLAFRDQVLTRDGVEIQRVPVRARFGLRLAWGPEP